MIARIFSGLHTMLGGLRRDERGVGAIELALATPMLLLLIVGTVDLAMGFAMKLKLEQAAATAMEKATVQARPGLGYTHLNLEAQTASGQPEENVVVDSWLECAGTRQSSFTGSCTTGQEISRYVSVAITGSYTPLLNMGSLAQAYGGVSLGRTVILRGSSAVRVQ